MIELALALAATIAAPHLMPLQRVPPMLAGLVWLFALALRAMVSIGLAIFVFVYLPQTGFFQMIADWCWHEVLPLITTHLGLSGHGLAHAAVLLPSLALAASLMWLACGLTRAWLAVRRQLGRSLGEGPLGSTVVADEGVLIAVTGFGRGRIVVSPAALGTLDDEELAAGLTHELGHLHRRHRPLLLLGSVLRALAWPLPGTRNAERELVFHFERDADEYAVQETRDPLALASAICKAAGARPSPLATGLAGGGRVSRRLELLVEAPGRGGALLHRSTVALATLLAVTTLALGASLPTWAQAAPPHEPAGSKLKTEEPCPH